MSEEKLSLREAKRLATHMSITDHATRLVMAHGFDAVTVEDICQAAGISRRTFFNYVDSKECAVFGAAPKEIGEREIAAFCENRHEDVLEALIALSSRLLDPYLNREDPRMGDILRRRKCIALKHPERQAQQLVQFHNVRKSAMRLLVAYFEQWPDARRLPNQTVETEALTLVSIMSSAMQLGIHNWIHSSSLPGATLMEGLRQSCRDALTNITELLEKPTKKEEITHDSDHF